MERRDAELALEEKRQLEAKRTLLQEAQRKQDEPVDDSKLVEAMFDFLPDSSSEAPAPKDTSIFSDLPQQRADQQEVTFTPFRPAPSLDNAEKNSKMAGFGA